MWKISQRIIELFFAEMRLASLIENIFLTQSIFQNVYQINLPASYVSSILLHPVGFRFGHVTYFPTKIWAKGTVYQFWAEALIVIVYVCQFLILALAMKE